MDFNRRAVLFAVILLTLGISLTSACGNGGDDESTATTVSTQPAATANGDDDAEEGRTLAGARCLSCHTADGRDSVGPTWQGLYGSEVELEGGETVTADDEYITESIVDPNAKVVKDFPAVMPSFEGQLTEDQIDAIIAYIRTLE